MRRSCCLWSLPGRKSKRQFGFMLCGDCQHFQVETQSLCRWFRCLFRQNLNELKIATATETSWTTYGCASLYHYFLSTFYLYLYFAIKLGLDRPRMTKFWSLVLSGVVGIVSKLFQLIWRGKILPQSLGPQTFESTTKYEAKTAALRYKT